MCRPAFHHCVPNAPFVPLNEWLNCLVLLFFPSWRRLGEQHPCELQGTTPFGRFEVTVSNTQGACRSQFYAIPRTLTIFASLCIILICELMLAAG
jgi:hypothetical protein